MTKDIRLNARIDADLRRKLQELSDTLGINQSAVLTVAINRLHQQEIKTMTRRIIVNDHTNGNQYAGTYTELDNSIDAMGEPGCRLLAVTFEDNEGHDWTISMIDYEGSPRFTTIDWQGRQPQLIAEVQDYRWIDQRTGTEAIMWDGLPVLSPIA